MNLDNIDKQILKKLANNSRITYTDLAEKTNVTSATIKKRIDTLVQNGTIKKFTIDIDKEKLLGENQTLTLLLTAQVKPQHLHETHTKLKQQNHVETITTTANSEIHIQITATKQDLNNLINNLPPEIETFKTKLVTNQEKITSKIIN